MGGYKYTSIEGFNLLSGMAYFKWVRIKYNNK